MGRFRHRCDSAERPPKVSTRHRQERDSKAQCSATCSFAPVVPYFLLPAGELGCWLASRSVDAWYTTVDKFMLYIFGGLP